MKYQFTEDQILEGMIDQIIKMAVQAMAAIDDALAFVEASDRRIAEMEKHGAPCDTPPDVQ